MAAYYNENDPFAAEWLRNLITRGLIAAGDVDERSIEDVSPDDLRNYTQCHFFAGIGGWSYALRLAGWPDDRPVWTGSCPCQPFSSAGARKGTDDPRHLWPHWRWLVDQCRPPIIFGEQVASKDGRAWLAGVRSDLEALGYAVGAADLCAAGAGEKAKGRISYEGGRFEWKPVVIGAPHIRQRLYWLADANSRQRERVTAPEGCYDDREASGRPQGDSQSQHGCSSGGQGDGAARGLADAGQEQRRRRAGKQQSASADSSERKQETIDDQRGGAARGLGDADGERSQERRVRFDEQYGEKGREATERSAGLPGFWSRYVWIPCADGKARRIEPSIEPLAHGVPGRVGRLRAYGNAIVPQLAAAFIEASLK